MVKASAPTGEARKRFGRAAAKYKTTSPFGKQTCILVLGMHRSGTSALTRVLNLSGAMLPSDIYGPTEHNPTGHWEAKRVVDWSDRLLALLGSSWSDWRTLDLSQLAPGTRDQLKADIGKILHIQYGGAASFVVKDPRISRFADFFIEACEAAGFDVKPILIYRNPLEVVASLEQRKAFWPATMSSADGALLWLSHNLAAERAIRGRPHAILSYEKLLGDWRSAIADASVNVRLKLSFDPDEIADQVDEFLTPELRHHIRTVNDVALDPALRGWVNDTFEALQVLSKSPSSSSSRTRLEQIRNDFTQAEPILLAMLGLSREAANAAVKVAEDARKETGRRLAELTTTRKELDEARVLNSALETEAAKARSLNDQERENLKSEIRHLREIARTDAELAAADVRKLKDELKQIDALVADRDNLEELLRQRGVELVNKSNEIARVSEHAEELASFLEEMRTNVRHLSEQLERRGVDLDALVAERASLERILEQRHQELADKSNEISSAAERADQLLSLLEETRANSSRLSGQLEKRHVELDVASLELDTLRATSQRVREMLVGLSGGNGGQTDDELETTDLLERHLATTEDLRTRAARLELALEAERAGKTELREKIESQHAAADAMREVLGAEAGDNRPLDRLVADQVEMLAEARELLAGAQADLAARAGAISSAEAEIEALRRSHAQKAAVLQGVSEEAEQLRSRVAALLEETQFAGDRIAQLSRALARSNADLERTHSDYRMSRSWRLTAPLRHTSRLSGMIAGLVAGMPAAVRLGGGLLPTSRKAAKVLRRDGLRGLIWRVKYARHAQDLESAQPAHPEIFLPKPSEKGIDVQVLVEEPSTPVHADHQSEFVDKASEPFDLSLSPLKAIAFYLPQFHPIPENDLWWGKGFTEWTNVSRAKPQFVGHYQPHVPGELGYYDLRLVETQREQVELAKHYGIAGFCYHHYWFGGHRLLERPFNAILANPDIDLPFCLCWANENWTRRWDGMESDILIAQNHSPEDDIAFIADIAPALRDSRYIRFQGRPILIVYRVSILPDARATAERWRNYCRSEGIGEIYLIAARSFGITDPRPYGFDAAVEFPPHNAPHTVLNHEVELLNQDFAGLVLDYNALADYYINEGSDEFPVIKTVCPGWDNEARKPGRGHIFHGSTSSNYANWIRRACERTLDRLRDDKNQPPFLFINAWNEWGEGAHLEPDRKFGYSKLDVTARTLAALPDRGSIAVAGAQPIVIAVHDGLRHGAQMLALNLADVMRSRFGLAVHVVMFGDGPLYSAFRQVSTVHTLFDEDPRGSAAQGIARKLADAGVHWAICNTTVTGLFAETLSRTGIQVVSLIHELPEILRSYKLEPHAQAVANYASHVVFATPMVADSFASFATVDESKKVIRPQGAYKRNRYRSKLSDASLIADLRRKNGLPLTASIVLGVGYADFRKGFDLFLAVAEKIGIPEQLVFVWLGHFHDDFVRSHSERLSRLVSQGVLFTPGATDVTDDYYAAADVFLLTSREDPYPSTVLEALDVGLPAVAFAGATGSGLIVEEFGGALVRAFDSNAMARAVTRMTKSGSMEKRIQTALTFWQRPDVSFPAYVQDLLDFVGVGPKKVSVVVPNFNYARFLPQRVASILNQTYPVSEVVILDDASTDSSRQVIQQLLGRCDIPVRFVPNIENSGSVFKQWYKGAELATNDYLWIAEADDLAAPDFLENVMRAFEHEHVVLSYSQSRQMAQNGSITDENFLTYVSDVSTTQWQYDYLRGGEDEIVDGLSVKNTIPNVSAVVFKRAALLDSMQHNMHEILKYRVAGDWITYVEVLRRGSCAFCAKPLSMQRRHENSVTISRFDITQLKEVVAIQRQIASRFPVSQRMRDVADEYAQTLYRQFKLDGEFESYKQHPELAEY